MVVAIKTVTVAAIVLAAANADQTATVAARRPNKRVTVYLAYKPYGQKFLTIRLLAIYLPARAAFYSLFQQFSINFVIRVSTYYYARID